MKRLVIATMLMSSGFAFAKKPTQAQDDRCKVRAAGTYFQLYDEATSEYNQSIKTANNVDRFVARLNKALETMEQTYRECIAK